MNDENKKLRRIFKAIGTILLIVAVLTIAMSFFGVFGSPPENEVSPPSSCTDQTCLHITPYGIALLSAMIAIIALVVSFVAFLLPFMILATGDYQMSFFESVMKKPSLDYIKSHDIKEQVKVVSKQLLEKTIVMRRIYKRILMFSIVILFTLFTIPLIYMFSNKLMLLQHALIIILSMYIVMVIYIIITIWGLMFSGKDEEGPYPVLAKIQNEILKSILNDRGDEVQTIEKNITLNISDINVNVSSNDKENSKKEGGK
jgi:amino acid transporter